jgi:SRSO17 transposase
VLRRSGRSARSRTSRWRNCGGLCRPGEVWAVLADAGYGISAPFRQALSTLGLLWAVGTVRIQKVYPADVNMIAPAPSRGRSRMRLILTRRR